MTTQPHEQNGHAQEQFDDLPLTALEKREAELVSAEKQITEQLVLIRAAIAKQKSATMWKRNPREIPLEELELQESIHTIVGKKGMGIRTVAQLLMLSRTTLFDHLARYRERTGKLEGFGIMEMILDDVDEKLEVHGLVLSGEEAPAQAS